jgi:hypothetical protein
MKRIEKLQDVSINDHWISRDWAKLKPASRQFVERFVHENESLDFNEFAGLVNRLGLAGSRYAVDIQQLGEKQFKSICSVLGVLHRTLPGFYGYVEPKRWVHPLDREAK